MKPGIFAYGNYKWLGEYRAKAILGAAKRQGATKVIDEIKDLRIPLDIFHGCYLLNTKHQKKPEEISAIVEPILEDQELRKITMADDLVSRVFAVKFLLALEKEIQNRQQEQGQTEGQGFQQLLQQLAGGGKEETGSAQRSAQQRSEAQKLLEEAKEQAKREAEQIKLYAGLKAGVGHRVAFGELLDLKDFTVDLRELLRLFKDISTVDFSKSLKVAPFGSYEGIKFGKDLRKITPSALALPDELFWYRFATNTLPIIETKTRETEEYLLLIDKSGSMQGRNKTIWSRAVALALAMHAKKNNLKCSLAFFDDDVCQQRPIDLQRNFEEAFKWILTLKCRGGTNIDWALEFADKQQTPKKVILITDGEDKVSYKPKKSLISVMIKGDNRTLREISEQYLQVVPDKTGALKILIALKTRGAH